jgi:hypothetical protein
MVVYDLQCEAGHTFEGWFDDLRDLKSQLKRGLVSCPACGAEQVRQVPAGFAIAKAGRGEGPDQGQASRALGKALVRYLKDNFEDVGPNFANEALKMHYGASEARNIRGVSTPNEEKMLREEGVGFFKLGAQPDASENAENGTDED